MPETYGAHECRVYFVQESTYGQTPANPSWIGIPAESVEPALSPNLIKVRTVGSRDLAALKLGVRGPTVKLGHVLPADAPVAFIQHAYTLNSLSLQTVYYKGLFSSPTDVLTLTYSGMRINKLSVECSLEEVVKATVELIGQNLATGTAKTGSYTDYAGGLTSIDCYVQKGAADGSGLATVERVSDWKFSIENNLKAVPVQRATTPYLLKYLVARHRELEGEVNFEFEDKTEFDEVLADSEFSLKFVMGGGYVLFKYCKWDEVKTQAKIEDIVSCKAKFVARDVVIA